MNAELLIVDDDKTICQTLKELFLQRGFHVKIAHDISSAKGFLEKKEKAPDVCLLDICLPDGDGLELLESLIESGSQTAFVMMTAFGGVTQSVQAMKKGASDYIVKPFNIDEMILRVERAVDRQKLSRQAELLADQNDKEFDSKYVVGKNQQMKKLHEGLKRLAKGDTTTVLIRGETGTGKEVIAKRIHQLSSRRNKPFVDINATALTAELLESELFGHEAGAFTGATKQKKGLFEVACGGTLFLDEIGDMALSIQAKLLRALQERMIRRVGGTEGIPVDIRLITATHQDLRRLVEEGEFREDLFYRLNVVPVVLPPLRDRRDDIPLFAKHFLKQFRDELARDITEIDQEALQALQAYDWPGNIRELRNLMERAVLLECDGSVLKKEHLSFSPIRERARKGRTDLGASVPLEVIERQHISGVLRATSGNKNQAAKILGIDRTTLYNKIKKYNLS